MAYECFATFRLPANTTGIMRCTADIQPALTNVVSMQFIGYKLRATTAPEQIKVQLDAGIGQLQRGYYAVAGDLNVPAGVVPPTPNNNGIMLTPNLLAVGLTDQDDAGFYSNQPQTVMTKCNGAISRLEFTISDFQGGGTYSQWSDHLYLKFKFVCLQPGSTIYEDSPAKRKAWQSELRDEYVGTGYPRPVSVRMT